MIPTLWNTGNSKLRRAVFFASEPHDDFGIAGNSSRDALIDSTHRKRSHLPLSEGLPMTVIVHNWNADRKDAIEYLENLPSNTVENQLFTP